MDPWRDHTPIFDFFIYLGCLRAVAGIRTLRTWREANKQPIRGPRDLFGDMSTQIIMSFEQTSARHISPLIVRSDVFTLLEIFIVDLILYSRLE